MSLVAFRFWSPLILVSFASAIFQRFRTGLRFALSRGLNTMNCAQAVSAKMASTRPQASPASASPPAPTTRDLLSPRAAAVLVIILAAGLFAVYSPSLDFQFILDDHRFTSDPRIQSPGHVWDYFTSFAWAQTSGGPLSFFRPIFVSWLRLNFILAGASPWGWHLLSIVKHAAAALLLGLLAWRLLQDRAAAVIAGALFALHPAQAESVAWVTVPDPLLCIATLTAILCYLKYAEPSSPDASLLSGKLNRQARKHARAKPAPTPSPLWLIASVVAFFAALLAKETAAVLPAAFFSLALLRTPPTQGSAATPPGPEPPTVRARLLFALRETLPFLAAAALYFGLRLYVLGGHLAPLTQNLSVKTVFLSLPGILWFYAKVLLWPVHSRAYADPLLTNTFGLRSVLLPALAVLCLAALAVWACIAAWKKAQRDAPGRAATGVQQAIVLGVLLLTLPILPALDLNALNPGDFLHGRYTYLPLAGLLLLLAVAYRLAPQLRVGCAAVAAVLAVIFSVLTIQQERPWRDDLTLFTFAHQIAPHNIPVDQSLVRAHVQVALGLNESGHCDQAIPIFNDAIRQYPEDWYAWAGLGECLVKQNDLRKAEEVLHRASDLAHEPRVTEAWQLVRQQMGRPSAPPK
jgi:protein O-mannosyl-transferase